MKPSRLILIGTLGLLLFSCIATLPSPSASNLSTANYVTSEDSYMTSTSALGTTTAYYQVANGIYSGEAGNGSVPIDITNYIGISAGGNNSVSLSVSSSYANASVNASVKGNGGILLYVSISQDGINQLVWSGVAEINSSVATNIEGLAYVNTSSSATLILGFASTNGIQTTSAQLGGTTVVTVSVPQFTFSVHSTSSSNGRVQMIFPARYRPIQMSSASVNATGSINSPVLSVGASAFLNATYPDMIWQGTGSAAASFNGTSFGSTVESKTIEFFGANGMMAGYAQVLSLDGSKTLSIFGQTTSIQTIASSTLIVSEAQTVGGGQANSSFTSSVNGQSVVFLRNSQGTISSTALIQSEHVVMSNGTSSTLVLLNTNQSSYVILNFTSETSQTVAQASAQSQKQTTVTEGSRTYTATQVNISATGNAIFNVTDPYPSVIVFKVNSTGTFQLNSQNYWTANGHVFVFDDPARTYYLADTGQNTLTTTSRSVSTSTGQSTATQSTGTSSQSATGSNAFAYEIAFAVLLVVIAVSLIAVGVRRRAPR